MISHHLRWHLGLAWVSGAGIKQGYEQVIRIFIVLGSQIIASLTHSRTRIRGVQIHWFMAEGLDRSQGWVVLRGIGVGA
jgi:hypothetical protein